MDEEQRSKLPGTVELFEAMPCGLLATAPSGTILRVNETFCGWVGLTEVELVGKRKLQELFTMGARIFHQTHWLPMLEMQGSISEVKFEVKGKDGKSLPMILNVVRRSTEMGVHDLISAFIAEDRNRYERELIQARKRAENLVSLEKDRALFAEQMIGIVSHDLRNPLAVILLATKMLLRGDGLTAMQSDRMLSNIARAGERARRLIEDLLDFTVERVGQGLSVSLQTTDLEHLAAKAVEELAIAHPGRLIQHQHSGETEVEADPDRLTQLLGNLVSNALTYGDVGGTVTVSSSVSAGVAQLAVHNTGRVITPDDMATMFDPMVRGTQDGSSKRNVGLGLFIVRAIAAAHQGNVAVTSTLEAGTRFTLTFPARRAG